MQMYILPQSDYAPLNSMETRILESIGERSTLRAIMDQLNLSMMVAHTYLKQMVKKGAVQIVYQ